MGDQLGYDEALATLRAALVTSAAHVRGFGIRAQGRPKLLSARGWAELAGIEAILCAQLTEALRRELRAEPWGALGQASALLRGIVLGLVPERSLLDRLYREASANPVERWRGGAPQLEATLWPFFSDRTRYLANTSALALDEPAPFPALIWHPGRREFTGG